MQKKGESTIIANLILFVAVMGMAGATVFVFKTIMDSSTSAASDESSRTTDIVQTDFAITSTQYVSGTVYVYVKNIGRTSIDPNTMDVYIDGIRIPRNGTSRTVQVDSDTDTVNPGIWDPKEELEFDVFENYSVPETHTVQVYASNGVNADGSFSS